MATLLELPRARMGERLTIQPGKVDKRGMGQARKMVIQAVCARAEEMGPIDNGGDRRSEKARNQFDNSKTETKGGNDQTYLARHRDPARGPRRP